MADHLQEPYFKARIFTSSINERLVNMKKRLLAAVLFLVVLTMVFISAEASNLTSLETNMTSLKADNHRMEKLRHGYITYVNNKITYYW